VKNKLSTHITAIALITALAFPVWTAAQGQTYTVLHSFAGPPTDGSNPFDSGSLVRGSAGNLYGTTTFGGASGKGVVFKVDPTGMETVLYSFTGGADGASPSAGLIRDKEGNLYGATAYGGDLSAFFGLGCGVVFKLDSSGNETVLYTFTCGADGLQDGSQPRAVLVRDKAGNLYGTTEAGGTFGYGMVFKLDRTGKETVLHTFTGADGLQVDAGLIRDAEGNLYGTTVGGGASGDGVVFKLTTCDEDHSDAEGCE
jgi:uncharacterized repeat protein (TIGR03803 family)